MYYVVIQQVSTPKTWYSCHWKRNLRVSHDNSLQLYLFLNIIIIINPSIFLTELFKIRFAIFSFQTQIFVLTLENQL